MSPSGISGASECEHYGVRAVVNLLCVHVACDPSQMDALRAKVAACRYYLDVMVPEAMAFKGSAMVGAELLYAIDAEELAA